MLSEDFSVNMPYKKATAKSFQISKEALRKQYLES